MRESFETYMLMMPAYDRFGRTAKGIAEFLRGADGTVDALMLPYIVATTADGKPTFSYYRDAY